MLLLVAAGAWAQRQLPKQTWVQKQTWVKKQTCTLGLSAGSLLVDTHSINDHETLCAAPAGLHVSVMAQPVPAVVVSTGLYLPD